MPRPVHRTYCANIPCWLNRFMFYNDLSKETFCSDVTDLDTLSHLLRNTKDLRDKTNSSRQKTVSLNNEDLSSRIFIL